MEICKEKLGIYEVMSYLNNIYKMGQIVEDSKTVRRAIDYLKESQKNDGLDNILTNWECGLKRLGFDKKVSKKLKHSLKNMVINLEDIERMIGIFPQEYKKDILGIMSSCIGLYFINQDQWKGKSKFEVFREILLFTDDGEIKNLKWLEKEEKLIEGLFKDATDFPTPRELFQVVDKDYSDEKELKVLQELFFRKVQYDIWKKFDKRNILKSGKFLKFIDVLEKIIKKLEVVEDEKEFINIIFDVVVDEYNLRGTKIEAKVNAIKPIFYKHVTTQMNMSEIQAKKILGYQPTLEEIRDSIDIKKLSREEVHITLMEYQNEYNKIKISYDLKAHKELREKVKRYMKDENIYISLYVAYFLIDSQALIDNKITALREIKKTKTKVKKLKKFKESLEKLRSYKIEEDYWNGREIEYTDFLARLCFLIADNENEIYVLNPQMMINICGKLLSKEGKKVITDKLENLKKITLPQVEVGHEG